MAGHFLILRRERIYSECNTKLSDALLKPPHVTAIPRRKPQNAHNLRCRRHPRKQIKTAVYYRVPMYSWTRTSHWEGDRGPYIETASKATIDDISRHLHLSYTGHTIGTRRNDYQLQPLIQPSLCPCSVYRSRINYLLCPFCIAHHRIPYQIRYLYILPRLY